MAFFKEHWPIVREEVWLAVTNFFTTGKLLKSLNHTFITLVPKNDSANSFHNYRPISLYNNLYKFTAMLRASRLKSVISSPISDNQSAFIPRRKIAEKVLIAHKLVRRFDIKHGPKCACLKLDVHKAFDTINRSYVLHIMECMSFPRQWSQWVG